MEALMTYNEIKIEINTKDLTDVWVCNYPCISNMKRWGWRDKDGSVVKSTAFPEVQGSIPTTTRQLTLVPEDLTPSHRQTCRQNTNEIKILTNH